MEPPAITMGITLVALWAARIDRGTSCHHDDINLESHQFGHEFRISIGPSLRISVLEGDILSFDVAELAQSQAEWSRYGLSRELHRLSIGTLCG